MKQKKKDEVINMLVAIKAYESMYQGMHGIQSKCVTECDNITEAEEIALDMSYDVIQSYCYKEILEEANSYGLEEDDEGLDELINERVEYQIWQLKDTNLSLEELDEKFYNNEEDFIEKYCITD